MTHDPLDDFVRGAFPPVEVSPDRIHRLVGGAMARLDEARRPWDWTVWRELLAPLTRFALPMAAAALLGIVVGERLDQGDPLAQFSNTFVSTTFIRIGS